jgi:hypothetical protein
MYMSKEVAMPELDKAQKTDQRRKKYLWFGYGNYGGGQPTMQIGGGNIRDPGLFEELSKNRNTKPSWMTCFMYAAVFVGLMLLAMLVAWGVSLVAS